MRTWPSLSVLAVSVLSIAGCSSDATTSTGSTITGATTATTGAVATTVTEVPTTPAPTVAPTSTIPGEGPQAAAETGPSAWIEGAQEGDPEVATTPGMCEPLYDAIAGGPYTVQRCGIWNAVGGQRMWTVTKGASGLFFAVVWQQSAPNNWVPVLRALEAVAGVWDDFTVTTGNIDSGANDELVSGIRVAGSGGFLSIDIVDIRSGNPHTLAVYNEAAQGIAALLPNNGVVIWQALYGITDPECCPSTYLRHHLTATDGDWFVSDGPIVATGDPSIPTSSF